MGSFRRRLFCYNRLKMTQIKALSLWQPWASLILLGHKHYETRSWFTDYRGKLVIHAAKKKSKSHQINVLDYLKTHYEIDIKFDSLLFSQAVAICDLTDCFAMKEEHLIPTVKNELEHTCGIWDYGRWAWKLENVQAIAPPVPLRGRQGLFSVDSSLFE